MLRRLIDRQRSVRRGIAVAAILGAGLFGAVDLLTSGLAIQGSFYVVFVVTQIVGWLFRSRWGRGASSDKSPLRQAACYGDPAAVLGAIDAEIAARRDVCIFGRTIDWQTGFAPNLVLLTPSWLVQANRDGLTLVRLDDLVWVFRFRRLGRNDYGIASRTHGFRVCVSSDELKEFPIADEAEVDAILEEIQRRRPAIFAGFDETCRELLSQGAGRMAEEAHRRRREWSALDDAGRERWRAEQREALDKSAQFLSSRARDKLRDALEASARSRQGLTGPPPDRDAGISVAGITAVERVRSTSTALVAVLATIPLLLLTVGTFPRAGLDERIGIVATTGTLIAAGWTAFALRYVIWSPARRLGNLLRRHGPTVINDIDADLRATATRWTYGRWPRSILYSQPDFMAIGAVWLIQMRPGHAELVRLTDLAWVHERVVPKRLWGLGDRYRFDLVGRLRDGSSMSIRADDEAELAELLDELLERRPALLTGWRGDWMALLEAGPNELVAAYEERERQYAALPPEKRESWLDESFDLFQRFVENVE